MKFCVSCYSYDATGNLVSDSQEEIKNIEWTVSGKVKRVTRLKIPGSKKPDLEFEYDASGQRIVKKVIKTDGTIVSTYYLRDATGNVMSVYEYTDSDNTPVLAEQYVYGSSRVGVYTPVAAGSIENMGSRSFGRKSYELSDHLDNVRVTLSDYKTLAKPQIVNSATDYYPFGMVARSAVTNNSYRFGFNAMEHEDELTGGDYDFGARIYDSRIGRWYAVDPKAYLMPGSSPYSFALNNPLILVDADGKVPKPSEILADLGLQTTPILAGLMDGFISGLGFIDAGEMAYKLATNPEFRSQMIETFKTIASDPLGFAATIAEDYKEKAKNILAGNEKGQYAVGEMVGELLGGALTGAASLKLAKYASNFKQSKLVQQALAKKPCGCFTSETLVLTSKGYVSIDKIIAGDSVYAYSDSLKIISLKVVKETFTRTFSEYFKVYFGNTVLNVTHEHPFLINDKWIKAEELRAGDKLTTLIGKSEVTYLIDSIIFYRNQTQLNVYNLIIEDYHTYYVSESNILVHNGNPCSFSYKYEKGILKKFDAEFIGNLGYKGTKPFNDALKKLRGGGEYVIKDAKQAEDLLTQIGAKFKKGGENGVFDKNNISNNTNGHVGHHYNYSYVNESGKTIKGTITIEK